jgi:Beta-propeller repeat
MKKTIARPLAALLATLATSLLILILSGCTGATPGYCEATKDCDPGQYCNTGKSACEPRQDSAVLEASADSQGDTTQTDAPPLDSVIADASPDTLVPDTVPPDTVKPDTGKPPVCSDDVKNQSFEVCDGKDLNGGTCVKQGFDGGTLKCAPDCKSYITSGCYKCSDKKKNGAEECDGTDFGTATCKTKGFECGTLKCTSKCKLDTTACKSGWVATLPGQSNPEKVAVDGQGNVYVAGIVPGQALKFGSLPAIPAGTMRVYVAKMNDKKQWLWATASTGELWDVEDLAVDSAGNAYVIGGYGKTVNFGLHTLYANDGCIKEVYIAKIDTTGKWAWAKSIGGASSGCDWGKGIAVDGGGNVYVAGTYGNKQVLIGGVGHYPYGEKNAYVAKMSAATGSLVWAKSTGVNPGSVYGSGVGVDLAGNVYLAGKFVTDTKPVPFGTHKIYSTGTEDIYVAKMNPSGTFLWATSGGGTKSDEVLSFAVDPTGAAYVMGMFGGSASFGTKTLTACTTCTNYFTARLNTSGVFTWAAHEKTYEPVDVIIGASSAPLLAGEFSGTPTFGSSKLTSKGSKDLFVAKLKTTDGAYATAISGGGSTFDSCDGVAFGGQGALYTIGETGGAATFGSFSLSQAGHFIWKSSCLLP